MKFVIAALLGSAASFTMGEDLKDAVYNYAEAREDLHEAMEFKAEQAAASASAWYAANEANLTAKAEATANYLEELKFDIDEATYEAKQEAMADAEDLHDSMEALDMAIADSFYMNNQDLADAIEDAAESIQMEAMALKAAMKNATADEKAAVKANAEALQASIEHVQQIEAQVLASHEDEIMAKIAEKMAKLEEIGEWLEDEMEELDHDLSSMYAIEYFDYEADVMRTKVVFL